MCIALNIVSTPPRRFPQCRPFVGSLSLSTLCREGVVFLPAACAARALRRLSSRWSTRYRVPERLYRLDSRVRGLGRYADFHRAACLNFWEGRRGLIIVDPRLRATEVAQQVVARSLRLRVPRARARRRATRTFIMPVYALLRAQAFASRGHRALRREAGATASLTLSGGQCAAPGGARLSRG